MITFACRIIKKEDVVKCSLNLNKTEYNILNFFFKNSGSYSPLQISKKMKLERTTVQKALKGLVRKNLVIRKKKNLKRGGYVFLYETIDKEKIKERIKNIISKWHKGAIEKIDEL